MSDIIPHQLNVPPRILYNWRARLHTAVRGALSQPMVSTDLVLLARP